MPRPARPTRAAAAPDSWHIATALVTARTLEEQLNLLLQEAPRIGGGDSATVYLLDEQTGELRVAALYGETPVRDVRPRGSGLTRYVLDTRETLVIPDTSADPRVNPVVPDSGIHSLVALPLVARRGGQGAGDGQEPQTTGVLYVNAQQRDAYTPEAVQALTGLAALAAVAIENTLLLDAQRETAGRLEDALRLREQFVSLASHELKSPLTPLKGYAQAIARRLDRAAESNQPLDEAWLRRALSVMVGQIDRLDRLVTDLLDVSRVRAGRFTLQPEPLDLVAFAKDVFDRFRDSLAAEGGADTAATPHTFSWQPMVQALYGEWDRTRLDQLLTNLLTNAVKYAPHGGVVELSVKQDDDGQAVLSVRDEGVGLVGGDTAGGVADPTRSRIFEAFSRGESAASSEASGFGLGLFICAEIARRHGGTIWAESAGPNQGTTFHVRLPLAPPADLGDPADEEAPARSADSE